eukprot:5501034-Alexandrium_andersonii.AAC.1
MSASLVGSEMCIRDRGIFRARTVKAITGPEAHDREFVLRCRGLPWAVSYTHLTLPTICSV